VPVGAGKEAFSAKHRRAQLLKRGERQLDLRLHTARPSVQISQTDATHASFKLTDTDPVGTNPVNGITFNTTSGGLTGATVTQPGWQCSATGVGDAQVCSGTGGQNPGQELDGTLSFSPSVPSGVRVCATTDRFVSGTNTTCQESVQQAAPAPVTCPTGEVMQNGSCVSQGVMDCDDFSVTHAPDYPDSIDAYPGQTIYLPLIITNVGNCSTAATSVTFKAPRGLASASQPLQLPSIAPQARVTATITTHTVAGVSRKAGQYVKDGAITFPPDGDPMGEFGEDPPSYSYAGTNGLSYEITAFYGPFATLKPLYTGAGSVASVAAGGSLRGFTGEVLPGSPSAPDPVVKTQVAVQQLGAPRGKCRWLLNGKIVNRPADRGKCDQPVWQNAPMTFKAKNVLTFRFSLPKSLPHGRYGAIARATLKSGITNHTYPPGIDAVQFTV
jgi:hypothetical protein